MMLDFLIHQLDRKLAEQYSDSARYRVLLAQGRIWRQRLVEFVEAGVQPFASHGYGLLEPIDFRMMLMEIDLRMLELENMKKEIA